MTRSWGPRGTTGTITVGNRLQHGTRLATDELVSRTTVQLLALRGYIRLEVFQAESAAQPHAVELPFRHPPGASQLESSFTELVSFSEQNHHTVKLS